MKSILPQIVVVASVLFYSAAASTSYAFWRPIYKWWGDSKGTVLRAGQRHTFAFCFANRPLIARPQNFLLIMSKWNHFEHQVRDAHFFPITRETFPYVQHVLPAGIQNQRQHRMKRWYRRPLHQSEVDVFHLAEDNMFNLCWGVNFITPARQTSAYYTFKVTFHRKWFSFNYKLGQTRGVLIEGTKYKQNLLQTCVGHMCSYRKDLNEDSRRWLTKPDQDRNGVVYNRPNTIEPMFQSTPPVFPNDVEDFASANEDDDLEENDFYAADAPLQRAADENVDALIAAQARDDTRPANPTGPPSAPRRTHSSFTGHPRTVVRAAYIP